jgi:hypothetical protein
MIETLANGHPADHRDLARRVRSHPFVDGPTRKLVRSWIEREPAHQTPWTPVAKPLSACRVALVSSAGIARHDQLPFDQELERRLGQHVPAPGQDQVKRPDNYVGRILATFFSLGIYMLWWFYNQMDAPNKHFTSDRAQEDQLVTAVNAIS